MKNLFEITLAIIKPHILSNPVALQEIRNVILKGQFLIVRSRRKKMLLTEAESFYAEHKNKFFYQRLVTFMTSGPLDLYILAREDAIRHWRSLMGPTKVYRAQFSDPDTIRGKFGLSDTRNATHGSDSVQSAKKEIEFFFPEFSVDHWYDKERDLYLNCKNSLVFDEKLFVHKLDSKNICDAKVVIKQT